MMDALTDMVNMTYEWCWLLLAALALTSIARVTKQRFKKVPSTSQPPISQTIGQKFPDENPEDAYYNIEPLTDFDINAEEPIQARPFKPKFHMTMAIESLPLSSLLAMDKTYLPRISLRRQLVISHPSEVIAANPRSAPAVHELYTWLTTTYLPLRYPTLYTPTLHGLLNTLTAETLSPSPSSPESALSTLAANIDTDFLILHPSTLPQDEGKYRLEAFATCFPSGFRTRSKLGLLLSEVHTPVPRYGDKLERSMDRFFASMGVGKAVRRWNWTVSTSGELFCVRGNHGSAEEMQKKEESGQKEEIDLRTTFLRCERQTLHRLPKTKALVFAFKTYQYPIEQIRGEECAEAFCQAIDGMATGSVPEMTVYKRQVVWGEKVKAFLRGEIEIDA